MTTPFLGEIRLFGGTFAPVGWNFCDGTILPISSNDALYSLIGTTYGGDGQSTFALPDLRGRVPIHQGTSRSGAGTYTIGETGGAENVTLVAGNLPPHTHALFASAVAGTSADPTGNVFAVADAACQVYIATDGSIATNAAHVLPAGGNSQPHENMQPFLAINYIIATAGVFPSQG